MRTSRTFLLCLLAILLCASCALAEDAAVRVTFDQEGVIAEGTNDLHMEGNTLTIRGKGTYELSGTLEEGQIVVDAGGKDKVTLLLSGLTVTNSELPALMVKNAKLVTLQLASDTENTLISGVAVDVLNAEPDAAAEGGAIHAKDDFRIEGDGALFVGGYLNNGIHTSNHLTIIGGNITVEAVNHGVKGKDSVLIEGGAISITSGKDGVTSDDTTGDGYGIVTINGGALTINASGDGIQAETLLDISGGVLNVTSGGGSADAAYDAPDERGGWRGGFGPGTDFGEEVGDSTSTKGLKSGASLTISGGAITVDAADDAIHTNGDMTISGGTLILSSGDDGLHADGSLTVEEGAITVLASYEGIEANQILLAGGTLDITSADDGLNAYGGDAMFGMGGRGGFGHGGFGGGRGGFGGGGRGGFGGFGPDGAEPSDIPDAPGEAPMQEDSASLPLPELRITGGTLYINAEGDGLDSNGSIYIEGGEIIVDGPSRSMNGAIDSGSESGGVCQIHGGTVLAIGTAGMDETFDSSSSQCTFLVRLQNVAAGSEIIIADSQGVTIFRHTAAKSFSSLVFSSPALTLGETYTISAGDQSTSVTLDSVSTGGQSTRWGW